MKIRELFSLVPLLLVCSCIPIKQESPTAKPQSKDISLAGANKSNFVNIPEWYSDKTILEKQYPGKQFGYGHGYARDTQLAIRKAKNKAITNLLLQLETNELVGNLKIMSTEIFVESQIYTAYIAIAVDK